MENFELSESPNIDPATGQSRKGYFHGDKPCPIVVLTSRIAQHIAAYSLIAEDLTDTREWLQHAYGMMARDEERPSPRPPLGSDHYFLSDDPKTFRLVKALWFSAIVLYGKCYASTDGRKLKLERANLPTELHEVHDKIIAFRNTIVAHAGKTVHESARTILVLPPNPNVDRVWVRVDVSRLDFADDQDDKISFLHLVEQVIEQVREKIKKLKGRLLENEILPNGKEYWYAESAHRDA